MFRKVLVANRGEIAVRIMRTLQEMGVKAVAIYSEPDSLANHVIQADEAYALGGKTSQESYLQIETILAIAKKAHVDAIHPGYGFLSENAHFARACEQAGITFIGPTPEVIGMMGDKIIAKEIMQEAGVPVVPGWVGDPDNFAEIEQAAQSMGYPVLIKAAAGGGGKGMRLVSQPSEIKDALASAAREAQKAFNDPRVFVEKYITHPRHIEFQILGDQHGNIVHLFERECSIQRRHQKIIEESPSPFLSPALRDAMGQAAINAAKAIGYTNAGTVEFIVDESGQFYFLEVNTRLQVEHPVTEAVTQCDLVRLQLQIASGEALPFTQTDCQQTGHAIECRIYAEDPANQFLPSVGTLSFYQEPQGPGIRVDSGVRQGGEVSVYYDPMLAKLIVWAPSREAALQKMRYALTHYPILGVTTNVAFLVQIITHSAFIAGEIDTHFLENNTISTENDLESPLGKAMAALAIHTHPKKNQLEQTMNESSDSNPWQLAGLWRVV